MGARWAFLSGRMRLWLLPLLSVVVLFLILMLLTWDSPEPFVYTLP